MHELNMAEALRIAANRQFWSFVWVFCEMCTSLLWDV